MPSRFTIREYENDQYYHIFNRGVEKRDIFQDDRDYRVFLYYLKVFLSPRDELDKDDPFFNERRKNFAETAKLICYCLMPNHFHLMVRQTADSGITDFMRALSNAYTRYFNERYERVGPLFQGKFKAAFIKKESYYLHLSGYIHRNPAGIGKDPLTYSFSSIEHFIDEQSLAPAWLDPLPALEAIGTHRAYKNFITGNDMEEAAELSIDN